MKKILIVDDDSEILEFLKEYLLSFNLFEVKTEMYCKDALCVMDNYLPHLLIIGYNNIDMRGDVFCEVVRNNENFHDIKIIGMSGNCSKEDVCNWKLNIDMFIEKPFSIEKFYDGIKMLVP